MRKQVPLIAGIILLALAPIWKLGLVPHWTQRLAPGWTWTAKYIGATTYPDPATGEFPAAENPGIYIRSLSIINEKGRSGAVEVEDSYVTRDIDTGRVTWEYTLKAEVDPSTGEYVAPELRGQYLVFPRHTEKKTYMLRMNYLEGIPMAFKGEEEVEGLMTYLFAYQGRAEYTESYAGTDEFPGVPVAPGQEIKCADDRFSIKVWIEPLTGEMLKVDEECRAGDYVYDIASGKKVAAAARWYGATAGDDVLLRADRIRGERARLLWFDRYIPGALTAAGLLLLAWYGVSSYKRSRRRLPEPTVATESQRPTESGTPPEPEQPLP